jgi:hypothetical protein
MKSRQRKFFFRKNRKSKRKSVKKKKEKRGDSGKFTIEKNRVRENCQWKNSSWGNDPRENENTGNCANSIESISSSQQI